MKKYTKILAVAIAAIMTIGSISFVSCNKEKDWESNREHPNAGLSTKETNQESDLVPILTVTTGIKSGEPFHKKCIGYRGTCWLWFGGAFLTEGNNFCNSYPTNLNTTSEIDFYRENMLAGVHIASYVKDSLDLLYDFSCVPDIEATAWFADIADGITSINDTIIINDGILLGKWGFENPVSIPSGNYPIKSYNTNTRQFHVRVPVI